MNLRIICIIDICTKTVINVTNGAHVLFNITNGVHVLFIVTNDVHVLFNVTNWDHVLFYDCKFCIILYSLSCM